MKRGLTRRSSCVEGERPPSVRPCFIFCARTSRKRNARCAVMLQELREQLEHLQASCLPEAGPDRGERPGSGTDPPPGRSSQSLMSTPPPCPPDHLLLGHSERGRSSRGDELGREVRGEAGDHSRPQGLRRPRRFSGAGQRGGESSAVGSSPEAVFEDEVLCETRGILLICSFSRWNGRMWQDGRARGGLCWGRNGECQDGIKGQDELSFHKHSHNRVGRILWGWSQGRKVL